MSVVFMVYCFSKLTPLPLLVPTWKDWPSVRLGSPIRMTEATTKC
jgi:hypothetical protein